MIKFIQTIIIILILSIFLPRIADAMFKKPNDNINVTYSEILDEFMVQNHSPFSKQTMYFEGVSKNISLENYLNSLPFSFYTYLISNNLFPYKEWKDAEKIRKNSQKFIITSKDFNQKQPEIFTIFESKPKYLKLGYNKYAISNSKHGLIFTDLNTLKKDENLSLAFTNALLDIDFKFPLKAHYTNPNTKKPFDEGVFLVSNEDELYHLKMENSKPIAKKTGIKNINFMLISENERKEFYGAIIDDDGVKLVSYDNYKLINLPNSNYIPSQDRLEILVTPLSKSMSIKKDKAVFAYHLNGDYSVISEFKYNINPNDNSKFIKNIIFPFEINLAPSYAYKFKFANFSFLAFVLNFILFCVSLYLFRDDENKIVKSSLSFVFGIYGFVSIFCV